VRRRKSPDKLSLLDGRCGDRVGSGEATLRALVTTLHVATRDGPMLSAGEEASMVKAGRYGLAMCGLAVLCWGVACSGDPDEADQAAAVPATGGTGGGSGSMTGEVTDDVLVRAAVVLASCFGDDGISRTVSHLQKRDLYSGGSMFWPQLQCLGTTGGGCQPVRDCLGVTVAELAGGECEPCVGSVASLCSDDLRISLDCATLGLVCDEAVQCSETGVTEPCDQATFVPRCNAEGRPEHCRTPGILVGPDCAALGLFCAEGYCQGQGEACVAEDASTDQQLYYEGISCEDGVLTACVGGRLTTRACADFHPDFTCQTASGYVFCGLGSECVPGDVPPHAGSPVETCEGTVAVFCNAGRVERVDCVELGFTGCDPEASLPCTGDPLLP
jgi:hypothetical protein